MGDLDRITGRSISWVVFDEFGDDVNDKWETNARGTADRVKELERLLRLARCPDENCDGEGTCSKMAPGYDGEADIDVWQCQWCDERKRVL